MIRALIGAAVAIIVFAVAGFGTRSQASRSPNTVGASLPCATAIGTVSSGDAVVDLSVAVVVESVAGLGFGGDGGAADVNAVATGFGPLATDAEGETAGTGDVFVDLAVTVVVLKVAAVILITGLIVGTVLSSGAGQPALSSTTNLDLAFADTELLRAQRGGEVIIDLAVAIVVQAVANLGLRFRRRAVDPLAGAAGLGAFCTDTDAAATGAGGDAVVDLSVAVVVGIVADFSRGFSCGALDPLAFFASLVAFTANGGALTRRDAVVDAAVAVVIYVVTRFRGGFLFAAAGSPFTFGAKLGALFTGAHVATAGLGASIDALATFIASSIAVFILESCVTDFCSRLLCVALDPFASTAGFGAGATGGFAGLGESFVGGSVAVVVLVVADLWQHLGGVAVDPLTF